jgi:hypothetical protein
MQVYSLCAPGAVPTGGAGLTGAACTKQQQHRLEQQQSTLAACAWAI